MAVVIAGRMVSMTTAGIRAAAVRQRRSRGNNSDKSPDQNLAHASLPDH